MSDLSKLSEEQQKLISRLAAEILFTLEWPKVDLLGRVKANGIIGYKLNDDGGLSLRYSEGSQPLIEVMEANMKGLLPFAIERATDIVLDRLNKITA